MVAAGTVAATGKSLRWLDSHRRPADALPVVFFCLRFPEETAKPTIVERKNGTIIPDAVLEPPVHYFATRVSI